MTDANLLTSIKSVNLLAKPWANNHQNSPEVICHTFNHRVGLNNLMKGHIVKQLFPTSPIWAKSQSLTSPEGTKPVKPLKILAIKFLKIKK